MKHCRLSWLNRKLINLEQLDAKKYYKAFNKNKKNYKNSKKKKNYKSSKKKLQKSLKYQKPKKNKILKTQKKYFNLMNRFGKIIQSELENNLYPTSPKCIRLYVPEKINMQLTIGPDTWLRNAPI